MFKPIISDELESIFRLIAVDRKNGLKILERMAKSGDKHSIHYYSMYLSEDEPITNEALKWLQLASDLGSADASWNLCIGFRERGDSENYLKYAHRALDLGSEEALSLSKFSFNFDKYLHSLR